MFLIEMNKFLSNSRNFSVQPENFKLFDSCETTSWLMTEQAISNKDGNSKIRRENQFLNKSLIVSIKAIFKKMEPIIYTY